jgi:hypothetical protein
MARNRTQSDRSRYEARNREQYGSDRQQQNRDRYYADDVGLQNLSEMDEPWWRENDQQLRNREQQLQRNYGEQNYRGREDYDRNYGRTQHFDESIAGRPSGFEGNYGYRAGSPSTFGTGGRFSNFGVGRNTSIGQSGYGASDSGRGFGRANFGSGESWRSQFDNSGTGYRGSQSDEGQSYSNYTGRGPKGYRRSDDRIREDVCEMLTFEPTVDATEIEVIVTDGNVTLSGSVNDRHQKRRAEETVENVSGVKDVHNNIRVNSGSLFGSENRTDQQLETKAGKESKRAA